MSRNEQYQPARGKELTDAQEVLYSKEFKDADNANGLRKKEQGKKDNPNLKR